jgi:hypothetical protein
MSLTKEAAILDRLSVELARKNGWPAPLLSAVRAALAAADPFGPDVMYGEGQRYAVALAELLEVAEQRPSDAQLLAPLLAIASQGAGIADSVATQATDAALDFYGGVTGDVRTIGATGAEVATQASKALPYVLVAALGVAGWYYLAGPGRGRS